MSLSLLPVLVCLGFGKLKSGSFWVFQYLSFQKLGFPFFCFLFEGFGSFIFAKNWVLSW